MKQMIVIEIWEDEVDVLVKVCKELKQGLGITPIDINIGMHDKIIPIPLSERRSFLYKDDPKEKNIKAKIIADVSILFELGRAFQYNIMQRFPYRRVE